MAYCPIVSYQRMDDPYTRHLCMGKDCALYDEVTGGCLIRAYLISQIEKSNVIVKPVNSPPVAELTPLDTFFGAARNN